MPWAEGAHGGPSFPQPVGTVAVSFTVDDTANKTYGPGELQWKGSFAYDPVSRKVVSDASWTGPFPALYDDGPWTAGGHEPFGSRAGDHLWGVTVFITPPAVGSQSYGYGAIDTLSGGWIWVGANGAFTLTAGVTTPITVAGLFLPAFGHTDLKLVVDYAGLQMDAGVVWQTGTVSVKGSTWSWQTEQVYVDTFILSKVVGTGVLKHTGLLRAGDQPEWMFVFGATEYRAATPLSQGITAFVADPGGPWVKVPLTTAADGNNSIVVP